mgnify:CR=1 FL=1
MVVSIDRLFDNLLACARGWRLDATLYRGRRREWRLEKARAFEAWADALIEGLDDDA